MQYFLLAIISTCFTSFNIFAQEHHHGNKSNIAAQPIIQIMQNMNENLANLSKAIMLDDYATITLSAYKIANHPPISKEDIDALFKRLGEKKKDFIACDTSVHNLPVDIAKAGKKQDMPVILEAYSSMINKAAECHKNYRNF